MSNNLQNDNTECLFCEIARGSVDSHKIWEDENHIAFLSIYPNTEGVTVVTTKRHYPSYIFDLPEDVLFRLIEATKIVAKLLDDKLTDVGRTALVFEGFGIDHIHAKLFPLHGTKKSEWQQFAPKLEKYFDKYEGYISSHDYKREDDEKLSNLAKKIRSEE